MNQRVEAQHPGIHAFQDVVPADQIPGNTRISALVQEGVLL